MDVFTNDELLLLSVDQLKRLADYFSIEYTSKTKKGTLVELVSNKIKDMFPSEFYGHPYDGGNQQVSVRIQRIRDQNLGRK